METAFGGGKTHTLIAARGNKIKDCLIDILDEKWIPELGEVKK